MTYVTQGTVQVHLQSKGKATTVVINAVQNYKVKHKDKDLVVFIGGPERSAKGDPNTDVFRALAFSASEPYEVSNTDMAKALTEAAVANINVEIGIKDVANKKTIVSVKIPAKCETSHNRGT